MIPCEGVEAAMRAWGAKGEDQRRIVHCILEAAAPHLMAQAWDDGEDAGQSNNDAYKSGADVKSNPYRANE